MNSGQIREAMSLWLLPGRDGSHIERLSQFAIARQSLDNLLDGQISLEDHIELLAVLGVDVDEYIKISTENLLVISGVK